MHVESYIHCTDSHRELTIYRVHATDSSSLPHDVALGQIQKTKLEGGTYYKRSMHSAASKQQPAEQQLYAASRGQCENCLLSLSLSISLVCSDLGVGVAAAVWLQIDTFNPISITEVYIELNWRLCLQPIWLTELAVAIPFADGARTALHIVASNGPKER